MYRYVPIRSGKGLECSRSLRYVKILNDKPEIRTQIYYIIILYIMLYICGYVSNIYSYRDLMSVRGLRCAGAPVRTYLIYNWAGN